MKKVEVTSKVFVQKNIVEEKYETIDGQKFSNEEEAQKHEDKLLERKRIEEKYKIQDVNHEDFGITLWGDIESCKILFIEEELLLEETIKDLKFYYEYLNSYGKPLANFEKGWNVVTEETFESNSISRWGGYSIFIKPLKDIIIEKEREFLTLTAIEKYLETDEDAKHEALKRFANEFKISENLDAKTVSDVNKNFFNLLQDSKIEKKKLTLKEIKDNYEKDFDYQQLYRSIDYKERKPKLSANNYFYYELSEDGLVYNCSSGDIYDMKNCLQEQPTHSLYWLEPEYEWFDPFYNDNIK